MALTPAYYESRLDTDEPVALNRKLDNRFYEPIVLLDTLNKTWASQQRSQAPDLSAGLAKSAEGEFQNFVNKLSQLCDSERGGKTVTAFVVLQFPDRIEYRFASNNRDKEDLICVQSFVEHLLHTLHRADGSKSSELISYILRKVLAFTRPRLTPYIKSLKTNTALCIISCKGESTDESESILEKLEAFKQILDFLDDKTLDGDSFSRRCENLIHNIDRVYQSEVNELIRNRSNEGRMNESKCWCELRHAATRLLSYLEATRSLVSTRKRLPELFENFKVCYIKSSLPADCPLKNKNRVDKLTMKEIIGRMTSDAISLEKHQGYAQQLERLGVDKNIQEQEWHKILRPFVHAEILVLESLLENGGTNSSTFFGGYKYIGCSKPTCRLCGYYFSFHPSRVEVRQGHPNLYPNWRVPDVSNRHNPGAEKERENLMNKILSCVRDDAFRTLVEKVPERKQHDSNTEPTYPYPIDGISIRETEENNHLARSFQNLAITRSQGDWRSTSSTHGLSDAIDSFAAEDDSDEEGGGAKL